MSESLSDPIMLTRLYWRVGRKVGRTIYAMPNGEPRDDDPLIGVMDSRDLAMDAVDSHNGSILAVERSKDHAA